MKELMKKKIVIAIVTAFLLGGSLTVVANQYSDDMMAAFGRVMEKVAGWAGYEVYRLADEQYEELDDGVYERMDSASYEVYQFFQAELNRAYHELSSETEYWLDILEQDINFFVDPAKDIITTAVDEELDLIKTDIQNQLYISITNYFEDLEDTIGEPPNYRD